MSGSVPILVRRSPGAAAGKTAVEATGETPVVLAAFGDLMLSGEWDDAQRAGTLRSALAQLVPLAGADLVFANLEATTPGDGERIAKEPVLIGRPQTFEETLRTLAVDVVSLANNHTFDACLGGFLETRGLLERLGINYLGAGENADQAAQPLVLERRGLRFGLLAFTDEGTVPSRVAGPSSYGVHPFDVERAVRQVEELRREVDHVVVSVHWGIEYCQLPSPDHQRQAHRLVDAGARLVIGHHAHVVQGVESRGDAVIAYNLGNALTTDLEIAGRTAIRQGDKNRSSFALRAEFDAERLVRVELVPFYAGRGLVTAYDARAQRFLDKAQNELAAGVDEKRWRRARLWEDTVLRTLKKLHPSVIGSVRPYHFVKLFKNLRRAAGGRSPAD